MKGSKSKKKGPFLSLGTMTDVGYIRHAALRIGGQLVDAPVVLQRHALRAGMRVPITSPDGALAAFALPGGGHVMRPYVVME